MINLKEDFQKLQGAVPAWHASVDREQWRAWAARLQREKGRLVALWGSDRRTTAGAFEVNAAFGVPGALLWLSLPANTEQPAYPGIADLFPAAGRMQRAVFDMLGIRAIDADDTRPWLRHAVWPEQWFPLRKDHSVLAADRRPQTADPSDRILAADRRPQTDYPFVSVSGDGVHEIPVGPVHAGTIEPGHFRFSVLGERILRLEERLGYKHKGIEKLFEGRELADGAKLAGRVSGDSTVAYAWAYAQAAESATGTEIPQRAQWLRALFLERERIANHLGDLGALGNDAGFTFALSQFSALKEMWLRTNARLFGHRYLTDCITLGGVTGELTSAGTADVISEGVLLERAVHELKTIYDDHAGVQDRFQRTGIVTPELAAQLGLCGLAGRASAQEWDLRVHVPCAPYDRLGVVPALHASGDVAARALVRFDEIFESLRLCRLVLDSLPAGAAQISIPRHPVAARAVGWIEGWRGDVMIALECNEDGRIERVHAHDPSWQNWPLLEHAVMGNIVPDFPLINKSFNLSYSGHDL